MQPVREGLRRATEAILGARATAGRGEALLDLLPGLFGAHGPRRYFLAFQTPSEARGGGGLIGFFGVLEASDGRVALSDVSSITEQITTFNGSVSGPQWYERLYGKLGGLSEFRQANLTPDFHASSEVLLTMYEAATGERLDGVVAMDPHALGHLTRGTGPLEAAPLGVQVGPDNAVEVLLRDSYAELDQETQSAMLADLIDQFWKRVDSGDVDVRPFTDGLVEAARTEHFKMFLADPAEEAALTALGVDGGYAGFGDNAQIVFNNAYTLTSTTSFADRSRHRSS